VLELVSCSILATKRRCSDLSPDGNHSNKGVKINTLLIILHVLTIITSVGGVMTAKDTKLD
jgi:hypothetical protein